MRVGEAEHEQMAVTRERLQALLAAVPEDRLDAVETALKELADPVLLAFENAPEDDEPTTPDDLVALAEARAARGRGETRALADVMAELAAGSDG